MSCGGHEIIRDGTSVQVDIVGDAAVVSFVDDYAFEARTYLTTPF